MFCRNCGNQLNPGAKFCKQCGNQLANAQPRESRLPSPPISAPAPSPVPAPIDHGFPATSAATTTLPPPPRATGFPENAPRQTASFPQPAATTDAHRRAIAPVAAQREAGNRATTWILVTVLVAAVAAGGFLLVRGGFFDSDATIAQNLREKLSADARFRGDIIRVDCAQGIVTLSGFVSSDEQKASAIQIASDQRGVKQVVAVLIRQDKIAENVIGAMGGSTGQTSPTADITGGQHVTAQSPSASTAENPPVSNEPTKTLATVVPARMETPVAPPAIVQAIIQPAGTSLQLPPGQMYIYAMVTGGARQSSPFSTGLASQVINGYNNLAAALAYGPNSQNQFSTTTYNHAIGGVSISGQWDSFDAFYGSNARPGASIVAASFQVKENSLVVIIGLAGGQTHVSLQGIPGLQVDGSSTDAGGGMPMIIAHATLPPGSYIASETSFDSSNQDAASKADLIGVFVFGERQ
jgi:BON domain/zinc-ribbon domain